MTRENWSEHWPDGSNTQQRLFEKEKELVKKILELGNETGELQVERPDFTAQLLVIALQSLEYRWAVKAYDISLSSLVDKMLEILRYHPWPEISTCSRSNFYCPLAPNYVDYRCQPDLGGAGNANLSGLQI